MTHEILPRLRPLLLAAAMLGAAANADEPAPAASSAQASAAAPAPTRHQLMKDCMAKQKAADSGRPKYELSQDCKDIVKTEKENAAANKKQVDAKPAPR